MKTIEINKHVLQRFDWEFDKFNPKEYLIVLHVMDQLIYSYRHSNEYPYGNPISKKFNCFFFNISMSNVQKVFSFLIDCNIIQYKDDNCDGRLYSLYPTYCPIYDHQTFHVEYSNILIQRKHKILKNFKSENLKTEINFNEKEAFKELYQNIMNYNNS